MSAEKEESFDFVEMLEARLDCLANETIIDEMALYDPEQMDLLLTYLRGKMAREEEAVRLIKLALDFWSAPGIDMPDIDTFSDMDAFVGEEWECKWDEDGNYLGDPIKPVGLTGEEHENREMAMDKILSIVRSRTKRQQSQSSPRPSETAISICGSRST
jgi:hypothetical protein